MKYKPKITQYAHCDILTIRPRRGLCEPLSHRHSRYTNSFQRCGQRKKYSSSPKTSYASSSIRRMNRKREFLSSSKGEFYDTLHHSRWYFLSKFQNGYHGRVTFHSTARVRNEIWILYMFANVLIGISEPYSQYYWYRSRLYGNKSLYA